MDPELLFVAPAVALLAVLGARRRASQQNGPTTGQRVETAGGDAARQVGGVLGDLAQRPGEFSAGVVQATGVVGAHAAGSTLRTVGRVSGDAVRTVVGGAGQLTARSTGLMVDGGSSLVGVAASLPGRLRSDPAPPPKKSAARKSTKQSKSTGKSSSASRARPRSA